MLPRFLPFRPRVRSAAGLPRSRGRTTATRFSGAERLEDRLLLAAWTQQAKLVSDTTPPDNQLSNSDWTGLAVALEGDLAVVGAPHDDIAEPGCSSPSTPCDQGSVFVFQRVGTTWSQIAQLTADDPSTGDEFGKSVAISNGTIVVGAPLDDVQVLNNLGVPAGTFHANGGSAYVFTRTDTTTWVQSAQLRPISDTGESVAGEQFGSSVAVDGDTILVGARNDALAGVNLGSVYVFEPGNDANPLPLQKLRGSDSAASDQFGISLAFQGDTFVVGATLNDALGTNAGAAYVFSRSSGSQPFDQNAKLVPSDVAGDDRFGTSVAFNSSTIVVGAPQHDPAGVSNAGAAYVFFGGGNDWDQQAKLTAPAADAQVNDSFGTAVDVQGDLAVVGAHSDDRPGLGDAGAIYVFERTGTAWGAPSKAIHEDATGADFSSSGDQLGFSVALDSGFILAGAPFHNQTAGAGALIDSGAAYVFADPNDAPVNTVPGPQSIDEDQTLLFAGGAIATSDVDAFGANVQLALSATDGTLALGGDLSALASLAGNGTASVTLLGTVAAINAALQNTTYTPPADFSGAVTVTVATNDLGNTGQGGPQIDTDDIAITVNPVNDAPTADSQAITVAEDGQAAILLSGSDLETAQANLTFTIASLPAQGVLRAGGNVVQIGDAFTGPPTLTYEPGIGAASDQFTFTVTDRGDPDNSPGDPALESAAATVTIAVEQAVQDGQVTLEGGVLRAGGTSATDTVLILQAGSQIVATVNGVQTAFPAGDVAEVRVWGRDGNDNILLLLDAALLAFVDAGDGNDIVITGASRDLIFGGNGNDLINAGGGNDLVVGGGGSDLILGGTGHDVLVAGQTAANLSIELLRDVAAAWAADRIADGAPDDGTIDESVLDENGDMLVGGSGDDWFIIGSGDLVLDFRNNNAQHDKITST